jgi:hypothetical protein
MPRILRLRAVENSTERLRPDSKFSITRGLVSWEHNAANPIVCALTCFTGAIFYWFRAGESQRVVIRAPRTIPAMIATAIICASHDFFTSESKASGTLAVGSGL